MRPINKQKMTRKKISKTSQNMNIRMRKNHNQTKMSKIRLRKMNKIS